MAIKCLDTYALVEINFGNPNFMPLLTQEIIITDITLTEFYGDIYKKYNLKTADYWYRKLINISQSVPKDILIKAIRFKIDHKKERLSFFDCVGYIYARENNMKFVTGDQAFEDKEGVEYIK